MNAHLQINSCVFGENGGKRRRRTQSCKTTKSVRGKPEKNCRWGRIWNAKVVEVSLIVIKRPRSPLYLRLWCYKKWQVLLLLYWNISLKRLSSHSLLCLKRKTGRKDRISWMRCERELNLVLISVAKPEHGLISLFFFTTTHHRVIRSKTFDAFQYSDLFPSPSHRNERHCSPILGWKTRFGWGAFMFYVLFPAEPQWTGCFFILFLTTHTHTFTLDLSCIYLTALAPCYFTEKVAFEVGVDSGQRYGMIVILV